MICGRRGEGRGSSWSVRVVLGDHVDLSLSSRIGRVLERDERSLVRAGSMQRSNEAGNARKRGRSVRNGGDSWTVEGGLVVESDSGVRVFFSERWECVWRSVDLFQTVIF